MTHSSTVAAATVAAFFFSHTAFAQSVAVTVSVTAKDPNNAPLSFQWRSTDGEIINRNATTTTWTLPDGPGVHFAYVLVSNGRGGYTERRLSISTDTFGTKPKPPVPQTYQPPTSSAPIGDYYRSFVFGPNVPVIVSGGLFVGKATSDLRGQYVIAKVPPTGSTYSATCSLREFLGISDNFDCTAINGFPITNPPSVTMANVATTDYSIASEPITLLYNNRVLLQDGSTCGINDNFFSVQKSVSVSELVASNAQLGPTIQGDSWGGFLYQNNPNGVYLKFQCENAPAFTELKSVVDNTSSGFPQLIPGTGAPIVTAMSAKLSDGKVVGSLQPPAIPVGRPSDGIPDSNTFLSEKGLDTRLGACKYYQAIGAVRGCSSDGGLIGPISFDDWKRTVKIDNHATPGVQEYGAAFVNVMDLNLARIHRSISYGPNATAAYVCNFKGPNFSDTSAASYQQDVNTAIANAVKGINNVACVAMDYSAKSGVNSNKPFTGFLIFSPDGQLLPSVSLDGRGEKFVPGTCVVCHGGDHYAGKFPEDGTGSPNIGAHFLPYDTGNFAFSTDATLTEAAQSVSIRHLNQNVLNTGPTAAESSLINGWYATTSTLNKNYIPPTWAAQSATAQTFYHNVIARSCRGCHVAQVAGLDFDEFSNFPPSQMDSSFFRKENPFYPVCDNRSDSRGPMPNSLVTYDRFWGSSGGKSTTFPGTAPDQPAILAQYLGLPSFDCSPP
jgi:hypothetical protein